MKTTQNYMKTAQDNIKTCNMKTTQNYMKTRPNNMKATQNNMTTDVRHTGHRPAAAVVL